MRPFAIAFRHKLALLFVFALAVRVYGLNWDSGHHFHPDERRIAEAVSQLSFSPLKLDPKFFAYGSFPFYVTRAATALYRVGRPDQSVYDAAIVVGRFLSGLWGALTVLVLALLGRRLFGAREPDREGEPDATPRFGEHVGVLGGLFLALSVFHVQNSHFATNDIPLTCLILVALLFLVRVVHQGRLRDYAAAGLAIGLATATKISALPVLLPLALAVLFRGRAEANMGRALRRGLLALVGIAFGFGLGEPYALLDFKAFRHDVLEQSQMVRHAGGVAYTHQYMGVPKYLYELSEIVLWGVGPFLGLAALLGAVFAVSRALRGRRTAEALLAAWVIPFFLITGYFEVKFPRYLLPIYPILALWAALLLVSLATRPRRRLASGLLTAVVLLGTALFLLAFLSIYRRPHTIHQASEWFYENVPPGSRVLTQDWDEGFPFHLRGRAPDTYKVVQFPFYEEDSPKKAAKLGTELAASDYVVFQTKRLYGAVTRAPEKYPMTGSFFRLFFAGDLGYTPFREFSSRPRLLGIELPSELADESYSVYDHPKALIFKNTGRMSQADIETRILRGLPSRPLTRRDLLLMSADRLPETTDPSSPSLYLRSSIPATLALAILLQVLGILGTRLASRFLPGVPGLGGLGKVFGVLFLAYPAWLLASLGWAPFTQQTLAGILAVLILLVVASELTKSRSEGDGYRQSPLERFATEAVFWGSFLLFLGIRALNPAIFWGEKPMDFAFLNTLYRADAMPPPEPWFSGAPLSYTYFGHFTVASLGKLLAIHPAVMFNLGLATFGALFAAALFSLGSFLGRSHKAGAILAVLALFLGNLSGPGELFHRRSVDFDYFWATSRVLKDTINEYPFWSFVFADLHAHVLVLPFTALFTALLVMPLAVLTRREDGAASTEATPPFRAGHLAFAALAFGTILVTNGWSTPVYFGLLVFLPFVGLEAFGKPWGLRGVLGNVALPVAVVAIGAAVLYRPFFRSFTPPARNIGLEVGPFANPQDFLLIFGQFLIVLVPLYLLSWKRVLTREGRLTATRWAALAGLLAILCVSPFLGRLVGKPESVVLFVALLFLFGLFLTFHPRTPERYRPSIALSTFAFAMTTGCEIVFVWDRMNTIFKFYLESWTLLAAASAPAVLDLYKRGGDFPWNRPLRALWRVTAGAAFLVAFGTAVTGAIGHLRFPRIQGPLLTLDGMAYLKGNASRYDRAAYDWLEVHVPGIPVLAEAQGPGYQEYGRVSMNTGLPIVLGWDYHVTQRGQRRSAVDRRRDDLQTLFTSTSEETVSAVLRRYNIALVYVGNLERHTYGKAVLQNFLAMPNLLAPLYQNPEVAIFAVNGAFSGARPVTRIEEVPLERVEAAAEEAAQTAKEGAKDGAPGLLRQARGVAIAANGDLLVTDFGNNRVQTFDSSFKPVLHFGRRGKEPGEFQDPCGIVTGPDGAIIVADTWNSRVQIFDKTGKSIRAFGGDFFAPRGIAKGTKGTLFISDTGNGRVVEMSMEGHKLAEIGGKGTGETQLQDPMGIAVDDKGRVFVCDNGNSRMQIYGPEGQHQGSFPVPGWRTAALSEPTVAIAPDGLLWVTVPLEKEVRAYKRDGRLEKTIAGAKQVPKLFETPLGIAVDPKDGSIVVTDAEKTMPVRLPKG